MISTSNPHLQKLYKITSRQNPALAFSYDTITLNVKLTTYTGAHNQKFKIARNNNKYTFCPFRPFQSPEPQFALSLSNINGAYLKKQSLLQTPFIIQPIVGGQFCYIKNFDEKALDTIGGQIAENSIICAWNYHGGSSQRWIITQVVESSSDIQLLALFTQSLGEEEIIQPQQLIPIPTSVPQRVEIIPNRLYCIVTALNPQMAITVNETTRLLSIKIYTGERQQFYIQNEQQGKYSFIYYKDQTRLRVVGDSLIAQAGVRAQHGKHNGSYFGIVKVDQGDLNYSGYYIRTHANMALDVKTGYANPGQAVQQYGYNQPNNDNNQIWLIVPANQRFNFPQPL